MEETKQQTMGVFCVWQNLRKSTFEVVFPAANLHSCQNQNLLQDSHWIFAQKVTGTSALNVHLCAHFPCASEFLPRIKRFILIWNYFEKEVSVELIHIYKKKKVILPSRKLLKSTQKYKLCGGIILFSHCCSSGYSKQHCNYAKYVFLCIIPTLLIFS